MDELIGATAAANRLGISRARMNVLLKEGRVVGARKVGEPSKYSKQHGPALGLWQIPTDEDTGLPKIRRSGGTNYTQMPAAALCGTLELSSEGEGDGVG